MYDSANPADIPPGETLTAGYIDGDFAWEGVVPTVKISVVADSQIGDVLDVESGDASVNDCPLWVEARLRAGLALPVIYTSAANLAALRAVMGSLCYGTWAADWTGVAHLVEGTVATQFASPLGPRPPSGNYDISQVTPQWPIAPPIPKEVPKMMIALHPVKGYWLLRSDGAVFCYGDAQYHGGLNPGNPNKVELPVGQQATDIAATPSGDGYYIVDTGGNVYAFGDALFIGGE
jgi:hypothetical protein